MGRPADPLMVAVQAVADWLAHRELTVLFSPAGTPVPAVVVRTVTR